TNSEDSSLREKPDLSFSVNLLIRAVFTESILILSTVPDSSVIYRFAKFTPRRGYLYLWFMSRSLLFANWILSTLSSSFFEGFFLAVLGLLNKRIYFVRFVLSAYTS